MLKSTLGWLFTIGFMVYVAVLLIYIGFSACRIATTAVGVEHRFRLFSLMVKNPFWRHLEQEMLSRQPERLQREAVRLEKATWLLFAGWVTLALLALLRYATEGTTTLSNFFSNGGRNFELGIISLDLHDLTIIWAVVGVACFYYQAFRMHQISEADGTKFRLFWKMIWNPFWRILERDALADQSREFRSRLLRLEIYKYVVFLGGIGLFMAGRFS